MKRLLGLTVMAILVLLAAPSSYAVPFIAHLDGPSEFPPVASPGIGSALVVFDPVANMLFVSVEFSGLVGPTTVAHIHCCVSPSAAVPTAGVATTTPSFPGFPAGVTSGTYAMFFDTTLASTYRAGFITANGGTPAGAEAALFAGLLAGEAYFNIHTSLNPGGEIRGFLQAVPEPGTFGLLALGVAALGIAVKRRRG
jgi:hypothetical protein